MSLHVHILTYMYVRMYGRLQRKRCDCYEWFPRFRKVQVSRTFSIHERLSTNESILTTCLHSFVKLPVLVLELVLEVNLMKPPSTLH